MALIIKEIRLEVSKPNLIQAIVAKQNDCNSRFLKASLWDEGAQIPIRSTAEVTINAERKDGTSDSFFGEVNEDNTVTVPLHSWMLELAGDVNCDVSIIVEGRKLTTTSFVVMVEKAANSDEASDDPQQNVLADLISKSNMVSQGRSAKYNFTSGGWKRILNIIRGSNGTINLGCGTGEWHKYHRSLAFDVCGFVKFPEDTNPQSSPLLLKRFENVCGDDDAMANPPAKITKIRVGYPKKGATFTPINGGTHNYASAPVNCYVDVYVEFDASNLVNKYATFSMNYAGFADSHNCESILEETNATDTGIYGEELTYYTVTTDDMPYYLNSNTGFPSVANALKGSAKGNPVIIDDVSPLPHEMSVKLVKGGYAAGEAIVSENYSFSGNMKVGFSTIANIENNDKLIFEDGTYWQGSGQTDNEINGTDEHSLDEFFAVGDVAYFDGEWLYTTIGNEEEPCIGETLRTFGKNLFNIEALSFEKQADGSYKSTKTISTADYQVVNLPAGVYTMSGYIKAPKGANHRFCIWYADGTTATKVYLESNGEYKFQSITSTGSPISKVGFYHSGNGAVIEVKDVQFEIGSTNTEYEPFKGGTYTADENGNVKATSIYPTTALITDNGASVVAEYNRDLNKAFERLLNMLNS